MNLRNLLVGHPVRLRYVVRFSTCHKVHSESVAEHSYYVALYGMVIADWVCENCKFPNVEFANPPRQEIVLRRALLHDLEEAVTGDINRMFKHSSLTLRNAIDCAGETAIRSVVDAFIGDPQRQWYQGLWANAKYHDIEGRIVEFSDYLSVLSYMIQELTNANITMREHWTTMRDYQVQFEKPEFDFIRELVDQAKGILVTAFQKARE